MFILIALTNKGLAVLRSIHGLNSFSTLPPFKRNYTIRNSSRNKNGPPNRVETLFNAKRTQKILRRVERQVEKMILYELDNINPTLQSGEHNVLENLRDPITYQELAIEYLKMGLRNEALVIARETVVLASQYDDQEIQLSSYLLLFVILKELGKNNEASHIWAQHLKGLGKPRELDLDCFKSFLVKYQ